MILEQPFSIPFAIMFISIVAVLAFGYKIFEFNKKRHSYLYGSPSVVVLGHWPNKTHFVKQLTRNDILAHPSEDFKNDIGLSYIDRGNRTLQFVDPKNIFVGNALDEKKISEIKKLNCKYLVYLFDVSHQSKPMSEQIKNFRDVVGALDGISYIPVMNKDDACDSKKLDKLKEEFKNVHEFPSQSAESLLSSITI
jgi:GTP1/Obg family GTP-binding protein